MYRFCVADTEHDWRPGTEQYKFIEHCLSSVDRQKQPWLIFLAHRVLGYSSTEFYAEDGAYEEPMGRESLQELWQKYKVDIAFYGHAHNYERTCPIYQVTYIPNFKYIKLWKTWPNILSIDFYWMSLNTCRIRRCSIALHWFIKSLNHYDTLLYPLNAISDTFVAKCWVLLLGSIQKAGSWNRRALLANTLLLSVNQ